MDQRIVLGVEKVLPSQFAIRHAAAAVCNCAA